MKCKVRLSQSSGNCLTINHHLISFWVDKVLLKGVELEDGMGRVLTFKQLSPKWIEVSIHEGRYHIIRRLMEAVGVDVLRLIRTKFGPISLGDTPEGRWRDLNDGELMNLRKALNL